MIRILVTETTSVTFNHVREALATQENIIVLDESPAMSDVANLLGALNPSLIIADVSRTEALGIDFIEYHALRHPDIPVVASSNRDSFLLIERVLRSGARGFVSRSNVHTEIRSAISHVLGGKVYVADPLILHRLLGLSHESR